MRLTWKTFVTICLSALKPLLVLGIDAFGLGRLMVFNPIMAQTFGWLQNLWWSEGGSRSRAGEPKSEGCAIRIYNFNLTIQQLNVRCTLSIDLLWKLKICIRFLRIQNPSDLTLLLYLLSLNITKFSFAQQHLASHCEFQLSQLCMINTYYCM